MFLWCAGSCDSISFNGSQGFHVHQARRPEEGPDINATAVSGGLPPSAIAKKAWSAAYNGGTTAKELLHQAAQFSRYVFMCLP